MAAKWVEIPARRDAHYCTDAVLHTGKLARNRPRSESQVSGVFKAELATFRKIYCSIGAAREGLGLPGCSAVRRYQLMYHHLIISSDQFHPLLTVLYVLTVQEHDAI